MLTYQEAIATWNYNSKTGQLFWKWREDVKPDYNRRYAEKKAGSLSSDGYIRIGLKGKKYLAHRIAWLITYGRFPQIIDHINRVRFDNRISNLREGLS